MGEKEMIKENRTALKKIKNNYQFGFHVPEDYVFKSRRGLNEKIVEEISFIKNEPLWMRDLRLRSYGIFCRKPLPTWGGNLSELNFDEMYYYLKPIEKEAKNWADLPKGIRETYDKLGIPEAEKKYLSGVKGQYESEVIYGSLLKSLEDKGVVFLGMDEGLRRYPDLVKEYFGTVIPTADNKFAALNSAVWSGGSFIYVPRGVRIDLPLQAYFRINAANMGQFERTLIIADEGSFVHYVEGCFTKDTLVRANPSLKTIAEVKVGDRVLTHTGEYKEVYQTQKRKYSGDLYSIKIWGDATVDLQVTADHPFLCVRRQRANERNSVWIASWIPTKSLEERDYLLIPVDSQVNEQKAHDFEIEVGDATKRFKPLKKEIVRVSLTPDFFRLVGYYLAEGSTDKRGYLRFSFSTKERSYIEDVKRIIKDLFNHEKFHEFGYKDRAGIELVFSSVKLARIFAQLGTSSNSKKIPSWMMQASLEKQKELVKGLFRGDGNYYRRRHQSGFKEVFRINTVSPTLALQVRDTLLRIGVFSFLNKRNRSKDGRQTMFTVGVSGEFMKKFGEMVGIEVPDRINQHKRATMFFLDSKFAYIPVRSIKKRKVKNLDVYNFGVESDESYVASVAVHNCSAPIYSTDSLHSAVVEIIVKRGARVRYTTIQNWSTNVYNLVTKRAKVMGEGVMEWVDFNGGSKLTMKYPSVYLMEPGARGEILSLAFAGKGQHQDAGGKAVHFAPQTSSQIISKSVSLNGGRTSYRGLLEINKGAKGSKSKVVCDALILDPKSRSDTYPTMKVEEDDVSIEHEASVSKIGEEQLFYLMSRGIKETQASSLIVSGFVEPIIKELPLEYALELNRLIGLQMEGSVG